MFQNLRTSDGVAMWSDLIKYIVYIILRILPPRFLVALLCLWITSANANVDQTDMVLAPKDIWPDLFYRKVAAPTGLQTYPPTGKL